MADYAQDHFYYGGKLHAPGDDIEPKDAADRKSLEERNLIGKEKPKAGRASEENKAGGASPENKAKGKV